VELDALFAKGAKLTYDYLCQHRGAADGVGDFGGYYRRHIRLIKMHALWSNVTGREFDCLKLLAGEVRRMGLVLDQSELEELAWLWYAPLSEQSSIEPDLHKHLVVLAEDLSLKLGIISNTFLPGVVLDRQLDKYDLRRFFPVRQYSSMTIYRKPDARIFQGALEKLQVASSSSVMVGDKLREDVKGARKVGMVGVLKRGGQNGKVKAPAGVAVIERIGQLPDLIRQWRG